MNPHKYTTMRPIYIFLAMFVIMSVGAMGWTGDNIYTESDNLVISYLGLPAQMNLSYVGAKNVTYNITSGGFALFNSTGNIIYDINLSSGQMNWAILENKETTGR